MNTKDGKIACQWCGLVDDWHREVGNETHKGGKAVCNGCDKVIQWLPDLNKKPLKDTDLMPWGKYKGWMLGKVPADYFIWLNDQQKVQRDIKEYITSNLEVFKQEIHNGR